MLFSKTQSIMAEIQALLGGTLISYWNNPKGCVCHNDVVALYEVLEKIGKQDTLYLFIKSGGGNGQAKHGQQGWDNSQSVHDGFLGLNYTLRGLN